MKAFFLLITSFLFFEMTTFGAEGIVSIEDFDKKEKKWIPTTLPKSIIESEPQYDFEEILDKNKISCDFKPPKIDFSIDLENSMRDIINSTLLQNIRGFVTPFELRTRSSKQIAKSLLAKIKLYCDKERGSSEGSTIGESSEVMMMVNDNLLESIARYGFQNQHTTRSTNGCDCRGNRYKREVQLIGSIIGYGQKAKEILPKYSGLHISDKGHFHADYVRTPFQYGNTAVVFKPEVKERTTFTDEDSLGRSTFRGSPIGSSLDFKSYTKKEKKFKCDGYCEAQIWGKLELSDVEYILLPAGIEVPQVIKDFGIKAFRLKRDENSGSMLITKGELLFDGSEKTKIEDYSIPDKCEGCGRVEANIWRTQKLSTMTVPSLISSYTGSTEEEDKTEILGELAVRIWDGKSEFLKKSIINTESDLAKTHILQGLYLQGDDPEVRKIVLDILKTPYGELYGESSSSWPSSGSFLRIMAMSLAARMGGFKQDKEIQAAFKAFEKDENEELYIQWFNYLSENETDLCQGFIFRNESPGE